MSKQNTDAAVLQLLQELTYSLKKIEESLKDLATAVQQIQRPTVITYPHNPQQLQQWPQNRGNEYWYVSSSSSGTQAGGTVSNTEKDEDDE